MEQTRGTIMDIYNNAIKEHSNKKAFTMRIGFRTHDFTYNDIDKLVKQTALYLQAQGVKKGDKVVIFAPNSPYWIAAFFACLSIGAIPVPINVQSPIEQVNKIIAQTESKYIFLSSFLELSFPTLKSIVLDYLPDIVSSYNPSDFKPEQITSDDLVQILYTSGTTGDPKGVMLSHGNMYSNLVSISKLINVDLRHDRLLSILPLSHIYEQSAGMLLPFSRGVHIVYAHSYAAISDLLREYKITKFNAVPEFLHIFMARIESALKESKFKQFIFNSSSKLSGTFNNYRLSRIFFYPFLKKIGGKLDTVASGGAFLDPELEKKWELMGIRILQGYGLTETSPCISTNTFDDHKFASVGKVVENVDVKIAPDKEILVKGPNVFQGYYKNPQKTSEAFDQAGYFQTGDMGEFDSDGFLFIKGRKKYMILSPSGQNVYPEDIEAELNKIPGVQDSCVVGIDHGSGVDIHAVFLPADKDNFDPKSAVKAANLNLASYQRVNAWSIWPDVDFPRTPTRKIKKNDVIDWIKSKNNLANGNGEHTRLERILSQISGTAVGKIKPDSELVRDLNLDSLMRVELIVWIDQEFGVSIDEADISSEMTVAQLDSLIKAKKSTARQSLYLKKWPRSIGSRIARRTLRPLLFSIFRPFFKVNVIGLENIKDLKQPVVFMPNHISYFDGIALVKALPREFKYNLAFAAAQDVLYKDFKVVVPVAELLFNTFPIQRGAQTNIKVGLDYIGKMLDYGYNVVLFPEGFISKDGSLQPLKPGSGMIAVEMEAPVVPVIITGLDKIFPYGKMLPRRCDTRVITVQFLKPLYFAKSTGYSVAEKAIYDAMKG